jgi:hypothetical protein
VELLRSLLRFFVFRNVWIALCALSMLEETRWFFGVQIKFDALSIFIFSATFFEYNLHALGGKINPWKPFIVLKYLFSNEVKTVLRWCIIVGFAGSVIPLFFLDKKIIAALVVLGLFTLAYSLPLVKRKATFVRIREITYLKVFAVAFVWSFVTVIIPMMEFVQSFSFAEVFIIFLRRFFFVFAITIPFEIRDMEREKQVGNISLPMIYGVKAMKIIGLIFIFLFFILSAVHEEYFSFVIDGRKNIFLPLALSGIAAAVSILFASDKRTNWYFKFWTDGTMPLQFILLLLFNHWL